MGGPEGGLFAKNPCPGKHLRVFLPAIAKPSAASSDPSRRVITSASQARESRTRPGRRARRAAADRARRLVARRRQLPRRAHLRGARRRRARTEVAGGRARKPVPGPAPSRAAPGPRGRFEPLADAGPPSTAVKVGSIDFDPSRAGAAPARLTRSPGIARVGVVQRRLDGEIAELEHEGRAADGVVALDQPDIAPALASSAAAVNPPSPAPITTAPQRIALIAASPVGTSQRRYSDARRPRPDDGGQAEASMSRALQQTLEARHRAPGARLRRP